MQVYIAPSMNAGSVEQVLQVPEAFVSLCKITREDQSVGFLHPTKAQIQVIRAIEKHNWVFVTKYRQAKITTITIMHLLLRDCMYIPGIEGMLIADTFDTAEMAFRRLRYAYQNLPDALKVPLEKGSSGSKKELRFVHGGGISIHTLEGRAPAVGRSIDRLHITELGEATHQQRAIVNLFPGINKRENAKMIIESTPGKAGTHHEQMWHMALDPESGSRFHPVFLGWWTDDSCTVKVPKGFVPTESELEFMRQHRGMTMEHTAFRRERLGSEFVGDERLVSSKYPSNPYDGWLGSKRPKLPDHVLLEMLNRAQKEPDVGSHGCCEYEAPVVGQVYEVIADPTGFGDADPAALTVFNMRTGDEVASWSEVEEPDIFAVRLSRVAEHYNDAKIVVESNNTGCITALKTMPGVKITYSKRQPGWWATSQRIAQAEFDLVRQLRESIINIRCWEGVQQLRRYDGKFKRREADDSGVTHHFDRARTYIMAAERLAKSFKKFAREVPEEEEEVEEWPEGTIPAALLFTKRAKVQASAPPSSWRMPRMK